MPPRTPLLLVLIVALALGAGACEAPEWPTDTPAPPETATDIPPTAEPATEAPIATDTVEPPTEASTAAPTAEPATTESVDEDATDSTPDVVVAEKTVAPLAPDNDGGATGATTLVVGLGSPANVDPAHAATTSEIAITAAVYNRLVDIDARGELQPGLADEWVALDGGLVYDLMLSTEASFHNGDGFVSDDVVWSLNRLRDPETGLTGTDLLAGVTSVEPLGDHRVLIVLAEPDPAFIYELADHRAAIVRAGDDDPPITLNGTGPFAFESATAGEYAAMAAHIGYHVPDRPQTDRLEFWFHDAPVHALRALRAGELDIVLELPLTECTELQGEPGINVLYHEAVAGQEATCSAVHDNVEGFEPHLIPGLTDLSRVSTN